MCVHEVSQPCAAERRNGGSGGCVQSCVAVLVGMLGKQKREVSNQKGQGCSVQPAKYGEALRMWDACARSSLTLELA